MAEPLVKTTLEFVSTGSRARDEEIVDRITSDAFERLTGLDPMASTTFPKEAA